VANSKAKTLHVAQVSIEQFFRQHRDVYFLTFTEPGRKAEEDYWTKDQAEAAFKPFRDLCARRGVSIIVVWERQKRGSWHPHVLANQFFDVNHLRAWMVERGWGVQMRLEWVTRPVEGQGRKVEGIIRYLTKYLTKSVHQVSGYEHRKCFCASADAKCGGTSFRWVPWIRPGSYLYAMGFEYFLAMNERFPNFRDVMEVIRYGVEATGWADIDPLWEFGFPSG